MKFVKQFLSITLASLIAFLILLEVPSQAAIASVIKLGKEISVQLTNGAINLELKDIPSLSSDLTVRQVILSLVPPNATGVIKNIEIDGISPTGDNGKVFGCNPGKVQDGVDLIKICGGPAILRAGGTLKYIANLTDFSPENTKLTITLCDNFRGGIGSEPPQCP